MLTRTTNLTADNGKPRPRIDTVDNHPYTNDGNKPVTRMAEMIPQFDEADVESKQHDNAGKHTHDKENIVKLLFTELHDRVL